METITKSCVLIQAPVRTKEEAIRLANDTPGTGLGLAIVQEVAQASGGTLQLADAWHPSHPPFGPGLRISVRFARTAACMQ